jgi:hypothetical protein
MANTVSTISYANTFGQWMVATDALIAENNIIAKGDYTKDSGTLYLSETTKNAIQANGSVVIQKQLLVQGVASSASIDNNLSVAGQITFSNTTIGLTNAGQANINGLLIAQGPNTSLYVANSAYIGGNTTIRYNTVTNNIQANGTITATALSASGNLVTNYFTANSSAVIPTISLATKLDGNTAAGFLNTLYVQNNLAVGGNMVLSGATIYASNTFQISSGVTSGVSSYLQVGRGSSGVTAALRWNEPSAYWDILNVTSNTYYRILTTEQINDTLTSTSTNTAASANTANALNTLITASIAYANANFLKATSNTQIYSLGVGTPASNVAGEIRATNNITAYYSDDRLKTRIGNIESALDKLLSLNGFYYQANETAQALGYAVKREVGVSAQEVQKVVPEIVVPAPIDDKYLTVHYERLIPLVIEAIKELKAEVDALKKS